MINNYCRDNTNFTSHYVPNQRRGSERHIQDSLPSRSTKCEAFEQISNLETARNLDETAVAQVASVGAISKIESIFMSLHPLKRFGSRPQSP